MKRSPNSIYKSELEKDWYPENKNLPVDTRLKRIMGVNNTRQAKLIKMVNIPEVLPKPHVSTVYVLKDKKWTISGFRCLDCGKLISDITIVEKHPLVCNHNLKINKEKDEFMPVHRITKNGEIYYRWGDSGKLYKTKEEAERQGRAAYASGYRQPNPKENK